MSDPITSTPEQLPLALVLTCSNCETTYAPSTEDCAAGRTSCPACPRGWRFTAELTVPTPGGAA